MLNQRYTLLAIPLVLFLAVGSASASPIVLLGTDLLGNPNVSLPNGNAGTNGTSVQFTGPPEFSVIIDLDLDAFGFGNGTGQATSGSVSVTNTRLTSDSDLWYGLFDGANFVPFTSFDGNRSMDPTNCGNTSNGTTFTVCSGPEINFAVVQGIGAQETASYGFDLTTGALTLGINSVLFTPSLPGGFNTGASLHFLVGKGSTSELHQIDQVIIDGAPVPEPGTLLLLGSGLLGLMRLRRRS